MTNSTEQDKIDIQVYPTPNPNAVKFVFDRDIKSSGASTYRTPFEASHNTLAINLFMIQGVDQLHFFSNSITVTKFSYESWDTVEPELINTFHSSLPVHNPNYEDPQPEKAKKVLQTEELKQIDEILDRTIRPGLQGDGGDMELLDYKDHVLLIKYQGACGTCPSSLTGTLEAIKGILRDEFDPQIEVYVAPND